MPSTALLAAMALWAVISGCMTVESCLLAAVNRTREQGVLSIIAAAVNLWRCRFCWCSALGRWA